MVIILSFFLYFIQFNKGSNLQFDSLGSQKKSTKEYFKHFRKLLSHEFFFSSCFLSYLRVILISFQALYTSDTNRVIYFIYCFFGLFKGYK